MAVGVGRSEIEYEVAADLGGGQGGPEPGVNGQTAIRLGRKLNI